MNAQSAVAQATPRVASAAPAPAPAAAVVFVDGKPIGAAEAWSAKPIGTYSIVIPMSQNMMLADLSIAETGGKLVATLQPLGEDHPIAMDATVNGTDLILELKREHGPVTIHLQRRGANVSGNWIVGGMDSGTLEGKAQQ